MYEGRKDLIIESEVELDRLSLALHSVQPPSQEEESEKSSSSSHRERPYRERQRQRVHPTPDHLKRNLPPHQSLLLHLLFHFLFFRRQTLHHRRLGLRHRHRSGCVGIGVCSPGSGGIGENLIGDIGIVEVAIDIGIGSGNGSGIGIGIGIGIGREEGEVVVADGSGIEDGNVVVWVEELPVFSFHDLKGNRKGKKRIKE